MLKINTDYFDNNFDDDMGSLKKLLTNMDGKFTSNIPEGFEFANQLHKAEEYRAKAIEQWASLLNSVNSTIYKLKDAERKNTAVATAVGLGAMAANTKKGKGWLNRAFSRNKKTMNAFLAYLLSKTDSKTTSSTKISSSNDDAKILAQKIINQKLSTKDKELYGITGSKSYWCQNDDVNNTGMAGMYKNKNNIYSVFSQGKNVLWADIPYSEKNYEKSACGATSVAIIASNVDPDVDPIEIGQKIYKHADKEYGTNVYDGSVTSYQALKDTLDDYDIKYKESYSYTDKEINEHLEKGQPIIVCVKDNCIGDGEFRKGHFVTLLGKNEEGQIFLGDPADDGSNSGYYDPDKILPAAKDWALFIDYDD